MTITQERAPLLADHDVPRLRDLPRLIHWESQSTTTERSPSGQRYIHHASRGSHVLLFVRETPGHRAYTFLGTAQYVSHSGERPMAITWRLDDPLPEAVYAMSRVAAG